jgi:tRNA threonylcarbamoyladenosine biosynthesis protein TsaE
MDRSLGLQSSSNKNLHFVPASQTLICTDPDQLEHIAKTILAKAEGRRKYCLHGDLGAGKTALVKAFVQLLGSADAVSSPTFALVQDYLAPSLKPPVIHHIDAYRLRDMDEVMEAGIPDYLEDNAWTFIEWPEVIGDWLPQQRVDIHIQILPDSSREIVFLMI